METMGGLGHYLTGTEDALHLSMAASQIRLGQQLLTAAERCRTFQSGDVTNRLRTRAIEAHDAAVNYLSQVNEWGLQTQLVDRELCSLALAIARVPAMPASVA